MKIKVPQKNVALFDQLYIYIYKYIYIYIYICLQKRDGDLSSSSHMRYKRSPLPYQILWSFIFQIRSLTWSNVLRILINQSHLQSTTAKSFMLLLPSTASALTASLPFMSMQTGHYLEKLGATSRLDIVWDTCIPNSFKESTREKRCEGVFRKVLGETKLPGSWIDFLLDPINKQKLFPFFAFTVEELNWPSTEAVYVTSGEVVLSKGFSIDMQNCNHEDADNRIVVHVMHVRQQGAKTIQVRTVDTDVVVILVGTFHNLTATQPFADIWIAFGMDKNYRFYHINAICASLRKPRSRSLLVFHAFSGSDSTSAFNGKGKRSY